MDLQSEMTSLCELARFYGTDKGGNHLSAGDTVHRYTPHYYELFKDRRDEIKCVVEIGVSKGCSLRMWHDWFLNAQIVGIDSNRNCLFKDTRIDCYQADQGNYGQLMQVVRSVRMTNPQWDLIIDDGSHLDEHQVFTARTLLPYLAPDGYYVIEDLNIDCKPGLIGERIVEGMLYTWSAIPTGRGLGWAYCHCGCGEGEQLLVLQHRAMEAMQ